MKTFYDLLDTRSRIGYSCELISLFETVDPDIVFEINDKVVHEGPLHETKIFNGTFDADTHLKVEIKLHGKEYNKDSVSAVRLNSFVVDDLEIKEQMTNNSVYEHDSPGTHATVTDHIGWNGTWKFDAGMPFYHFKHKIKNRGWLITPE